MKRLTGVKKNILSLKTAYGGTFTRDKKKYHQKYSMVERLARVKKNYNNIFKGPYDQKINIWQHALVERIAGVKKKYTYGGTFTRGKKK